MDQQLEQRIAQFENMAQADPDNEMAHFSLGNAYAQAGRPADAAASFLRCVELAPGMSKAYQLAAEQLLAAGQQDRAAEVAADGYSAAASRGDRMPQQALGEILQRLGRSLPEAPAAGGQGPSAGAGAAAAGSFVCQRTGRPGTQMERAPFRGPVGEWIRENISKETFAAWIAQGTKVINELRLDLSREDDATVYDEHMREFLGIDEELHERIKGGEG